ncbi:MAG: geranylgeranylglycerol-phosphate geranylgeranyltransferase [Chitinophagales bacterium]|nr:geranylgeranylglycerol-phosphate geranylgeranyltransferase [Chitinophagales bacterium]MDW8394505.1 geranylgeranylglycerol-phosphate geranylgeranyltransferase [Chitinophagales bacterium]
MAVRKWFRLVRGNNLLLIALTQLLVHYTLIVPILKMAGLSPTLANGWVAVLVLATVLVAAGGYIINDYFDVKTDTINRPGRVVIDRSIPRRHALLLHQITTWAGIVLAVGVSWKVANLKLAGVFLLAAAMLWLYSAAYKRKALAGNIVVALLTALVVILPPLYERQLFQPAGGPAMQAARTILIVVFCYFVFAFLLSLVREWVKDLQDMEGDRRSGRRTLPLLWGQVRVRQLSVLLLLLIMLLIGIVQGYQLSGRDYVSVFTLIVMLQLPLAASVYFLLWPQRSEPYRLVSHLLKWTMLMGILTMLYFYLVTLPR